MNNLYYNPHHTGPPLPFAVTNLIKVNPPQLPVTLPLECRPRMQHGKIIAHQHIPLLPAKIQTHPPVIEHLIHQAHIVVAPVLDVDHAIREFGLPFRPGLMPSHARFLGGRVRDDQGQVAHVVVPEAAVLAVPGKGLQFGKRVSGRQVLEKQRGGGEERIPRPRRAGGNGREILEAWRVRHGNLLAGFVVDFLDELEHAVVVHRHRLGADDVVGHAIGAPGVFDFLLDAERPGGDGAEVVRLGFEGMLVGGVGEVTQHDGRAVFGEPAHFLHVHVVQAVFAGGVSGRRDEASRVHVVEGDVHAGPMEEWAAFTEVRGAARGVEDDIMGAGRYGEGVGHGNGAVEGLDEGGVPGRHLAAALLGNQGHGEFTGFGGGVDGQADVRGEFVSNGICKGLFDEQSQCVMGKLRSG